MQNIYEFEFNDRHYKTYHSVETAKEVYRELMEELNEYYADKDDTMPYIDIEEFVYGFCMVEFEHTTKQQPVANLMSYVKEHVDVNKIVGAVVLAHLLDVDNYYSYLDIMRYATGEEKAE